MPIPIPKPIYSPLLIETNEMFYSKLDTTISIPMNKLCQNFEILSNEQTEK